MRVVVGNVCKRAAIAALAALVGGAVFSAVGARAQTAPTQSPSPSTKSAEGETGITLPRGVIVPILVTREVRVGASGTSPQEHKVKFAVDQDVIVNGHLIAKAGDLAEGHYDTQTNQTKRTFSTNVSQEVELDIDDIVNFCGDTIYLQFERTFVGGTRSGFLSFGVHEHDAVFGKGAVLEASTDRTEKRICAQATTEIAQPVPKNIILPDPQLTPSPLPRASYAATAMP